MARKKRTKTKTRRRTSTRRRTRTAKGIACEGQCSDSEDASTPGTTKPVGSSVKDVISSDREVSGYETPTDVEIVSTITEPTLPHLSSTHNIKINKFVLNKKHNIKKKLSQMDREFQIVPRDEKRQYKLEMGTATYHIFIKNIVNLGQKYGHLFECDDVDAKGEELKTQYYVNLSSGNGKVIPISLTCYHTNNSMLIQLKKSEHPLNERIDILESFMKNTVEKIMLEIESTSQHADVREQLCTQLLEAQQQHHQSFPEVANVMDEGHPEESPIVNEHLDESPNVIEQDTPDVRSYLSLVESGVPNPLHSEYLESENSQSGPIAATPLRTVQGKESISLKRELELSLSASTVSLVKQNEKKGSFDFNFPQSVVRVDTRIVKEIEFDGSSRENEDHYLNEAILLKNTLNLYKCTDDTKTVVGEEVMKIVTTDVFHGHEDACNPDFKSDRDGIEKVDSATQPVSGNNSQVANKCKCELLGQQLFQTHQKLKVASDRIKHLEDSNAYRKEVIRLEEKVEAMEKEKQDLVGNLEKVSRENLNFINVIETHEEEEKSRQAAFLENQEKIRHEKEKGNAEVEKHNVEKVEMMQAMEV